MNATATIATNAKSLESTWTDSMSDAMLREYREFIERKSQLDIYSGFEPLSIPDYLFDFQKHLVDWAVRKGRAMISADCGLGKTPMQLVWADNIVRKTNKPVLLLTPLGVSAQTMREAEKFGIDCQRSKDGQFNKKIVVTNYESLHHFNSSDFCACVCDESSILKNFDGVRKSEITEFMRKMEYRLLCTATAAPNDYIELGTSSEALGYLGYMDMLTRFFKNEQNTIKPRIYLNKGNVFSASRERAKFRFKGHAEIPFWQWVCSWARAIRRPSDLGYEDDGFILPELIERDHLIDVNKPAEGFLFVLPAVGLKEQREERRRTIQERCEKAAELANNNSCSLVWCHMNEEGDLLERLIPDCVQVSGKDEDDEKEEKFLAFVSGQATRLITKPKIGCWGLNFQHCSHETFFPSHSFEQYYQGVRRCWRFGQKNKVIIDIVTTEGEKDVMKNLQRKAQAADKMFSSLVEYMNQSLHIRRSLDFNMKEDIPSWLSPSN